MSAPRAVGYCAEHGRHFFWDQACRDDGEIPTRRAISAWFDRDLRSGADAESIGADASGGTQMKQARCGICGTDLGCLVVIGADPRCADHLHTDD
jgi:hypothetical protein